MRNPWTSWVVGLGMLLGACGGAGAGEPEPKNASTAPTTSGASQADAKPNAPSRQDVFLATQDERDRLYAYVNKTKGTCAERELVEAEIAKIAAVVEPAARERITADTRASFGKKRQQARTMAIRSVQGSLDKRPTFESAEDPSAAAAQQISELRLDLGGVTCKGEDESGDAYGLTAKVDAWATEVTRAADAEKQCRADANCMAERAAKPLCTALADKKMHQQELARERANPAGVVNLGALHSYGQAIQADDDRIKAARADYAKANKVPFSEKLCAKR